MAATGLTVALEQDLRAGLQVEHLAGIAPLAELAAGYEQSLNRTMLFVSVLALGALGVAAWASRVRSED